MDEHQHPQDEHESIQSAAQRLAVHPAWIRRRIDEGVLPAYRVRRGRSRIVRLRRADVDRLLEPVNLKR